MNSHNQVLKLIPLLALAVGLSAASGQTGSNVQDPTQPLGSKAGFAERWSIREAAEPPTPEQLAEQTERFYSGARGIRVEQTAEQNGVLEYRVTSYMAPEALRTEVYNPDGTVYTVFSWIDGEVREYRPRVASVNGPPFTGVLMRYDGTELPEVQRHMLVPSEESCKTGNLSISWIAAADTEPSCEAHARYMREGVVVGEGTVGSVECWVVRRAFSVPDEDGMLDIEHLHFTDKETGRPVRWVTTQGSASSSIELVREFQRIEILREAPEVDWRLGDLVTRQPPRESKKGSGNE